MARDEIREVSRGCWVPGLLRQRRAWVLQLMESQGRIPADRGPVASENSYWPLVEEGVGGARPRLDISG